ncbi:1-acyl-sn-glycerol-3-phosphate acyltransferase [Candidatus Poribacteria bacterium]|nr:1-acyl-sn-glycerol-3-phosphate acyltransferase [Candidatus Poribacteria bacterium]
MRRIAVWVLRLALALFYRRIDVAGGERFPDRGPVLVAANHFNSLADALVLMAALPRAPVFAAAVFLFKKPLLGSVLRGVGCVPIHRGIDEGADPRDNVESLSALGKRLREGGAVVIFPEGVSKLEPRLQKIKVGTARLAFQAEEAEDWRLGLTVLPVGLQYEASMRWRSAVRVVVGDPLPLEQFRAAYAEHARRAMGEMTRELESRLRRLSLHAESWTDREDAILAARCYLAECEAGTVKPLAGLGELARTAEAGSQTAEVFLAWLARAEAKRPDDLAKLRRQLHRLRAALGLIGLHPEELESGRSMASMVGGMLLPAFWWLAALPAGVWGRANSWLVEKAVAQFQRRFNKDGIVAQSTWILLPGLLLGPIVHTVQTIMLLAVLLLSGASLLASVAWALVYAATLIPSWFVSLRLRDLRHDRLRWAQAFGIVLRHRQTCAHLLGERQKIARALEGMAGELAESRET